MARSGPIKKFLFERSFDDPAKLYMPGERRKSEIAAAEAAEAAARTAAMALDVKAAARAVEEKAEPPKPEVKAEFTQAQLDAAREEGYIQGHSAALEEAGTAREHYVADAINLIAQNLGKLDENQPAANEELANGAMRMAYGVISKLLPEIGRQYALENVESFIRQILPVAVGEQRILIRAHEMIAADLDERLRDVFARASFQGAYSVIVDYELQPGDCRVEWEGGGADRNEGRIWHNIREVIAANFGDVDVAALDAAADKIAAEAPPQESTQDALPEAPEEEPLQEPSQEPEQTAT